MVEISTKTTYLLIGYYCIFSFGQVIECIDTLRQRI